MRRALDVQTFGAALLVGAFVAAEASALWLELCPGSPWAWFLNLGVFRAFERARAEASPLRGLFGPASLPAGIAVLLAVGAARALRLRFGTALLANLSFVAAACLALAWSRGNGRAEWASLAPADSLRSEGGFLVVVLLLSSFAALVQAHLTLIARIRRDRHAGPRRPAEASYPA